MTTWWAGNGCSTVAPAAVSRSTSLVILAHRSSGLPVPATRRSRWRRFLATLGSGTRSSDSRGPIPSGSCSHAPSSGPASGSACCSHSCLVAKGAGGGSSWSPSASFQNDASLAALAQSSVSSILTAIHPSSLDSRRCERTAMQPGAGGLCVLSGRDLLLPDAVGYGGAAGHG